MAPAEPRPAARASRAGYATWQQARHLVRPGLTGLWQVTRRGDGALLHECIELDLRYIDGVSAAADLRLLLRTPAALLRTGNIV